MQRMSMRGCSGFADALSKSGRWAMEHGFGDLQIQPGLAPRPARYEALALGVLV